jgi:hypothetical protein
MEVVTDLTTTSQYTQIPVLKLETSPFFSPVRYKKMREYTWMRGMSSFAIFLKPYDRMLTSIALPVAHPTLDSSLTAPLLQVILHSVYAAFETALTDAAVSFAVPGPCFSVDIFISLRSPAHLFNPIIPPRG